MHIRIPEFEKVNIRKRLLLETAIYGLLTAVYTSMFFFGALYPGYGIPSEAVERQQETTEEAASRTDKTKETDRPEEADKAKEADRAEEADKAKEADRAEEADKTKEADRPEEADKAKEADRAEETDKTEKAEEEIVYKSLLLEKLKEWF